MNGYDPKSAPPNYFHPQVQPQQLPLSQYNMQPQQPPSLNVQVQAPAPPPPIIIQQQPYMGSRNVCCMTARSWTLFIAWTQMIGCGLMFILSIVVLAQLAELKVWIIKYYYNDYSVTKQNIDDYLNRLDGIRGMSPNQRTTFVDNLYNIVLITMIVLTVSSGSGFFTGLILQQGVSQKKPTFLTIWIIYSIMNILLGIGMSIAISAMMEYYNNGSTFFISSTLVSIFYIWVVGKHRQELERQNSMKMSMAATSTAQIVQPQLINYQNHY